MRKTGARTVDTPPSVGATGAGGAPKPSPEAEPRAVCEQAARLGRVAGWDPLHAVRTEEFPLEIEDVDRRPVARRVRDDLAVPHPHAVDSSELPRTFSLTAGLQYELSVGTEDAQGHVGVVDDEHATVGHHLDTADAAQEIRRFPFNLSDREIGNWVDRPAGVVREIGTRGLDDFDGCAVANAERAGFCIRTAAACRDE